MEPILNGEWSAKRIEVQKWSAGLHSALQSNNWSGVLVGVQQSTFRKIDWLINGLHSEKKFGFGLWIALQNTGVFKYPVQPGLLEQTMQGGIGIRVANYH